MQPSNLVESLHMVAKPSCTLLEGSYSVAAPEELRHTHTNLEYNIDKAHKLPVGEDFFEGYRTNTHTPQCRQCHSMDRSVRRCSPPHSLRYFVSEIWPRQRGDVA